VSSKFILSSSWQCHLKPTSVHIHPLYLPAPDRHNCYTQ
jgi:hypothetical protein